MYAVHGAGENSQNPRILCGRLLALPPSWLQSSFSRGTISSPLCSAAVCAAFLLYVTGVFPSVRPTDQRAKSVRRAGSSMERVGLEALHPPQGPPGSGAPALSGLPDLSRAFTVLGIETSCDDTAAAVVRSDGAVLGEVTGSSTLCVDTYQ